jgi:hypothetical protein
MKTFKIDDIINKQPLGSIERLFMILIYRNDERAKASYRCIIRRLKKMNSEKRERTFEKFIVIFYNEIILSIMFLNNHATK